MRKKKASACSMDGNNRFLAMKMYFYAWKNGKSRLNSLPEKAVVFAEGGNFAPVGQIRKIAFDRAADEKILLQGVVDCCVVKDNKLTIIDYKTDYVNETNLQSKIELYKGQLKVYERAMTEITGMPVAEKIIYFFSVNKGIFV